MVRRQTTFRHPTDAVEPAGAVRGARSGNRVEPHVSRGRHAPPETDRIKGVRTTGGINPAPRYDEGNVDNAAMTPSADRLRSKARKPTVTFALAKRKMLTTYLIGKKKNAYNLSEAQNSSSPAARSSRLLSDVRSRNAGRTRWLNAADGSRHAQRSARRPEQSDASCIPP